MYLTPNSCGNFSDSDLASLQRIFAGLDLAEQEPRQAREPNGRPARARGRTLVILDGGKVFARMRRLGIDARALGKKLHIWRLSDLVDYGELAPRQAERLARELDVSVGEITLGTRTP